MESLCRFGLKIPDRVAESLSDLPDIVLSLLQTVLGNLFIEYLAGAGRAAINRYREQWHLPPIRQTNDFFSRLAQITQIPAQFDFPGRNYRLVFITRARLLMLKLGSPSISHGTGFRRPDR